VVNSAIMDEIVNSYVRLTIMMTDVFKYMMIIIMIMMMMMMSLIVLFVSMMVKM